MWANKYFKQLFCLMVLTNDEKRLGHMQSPKLPSRVYTMDNRIAQTTFQFTRTLAHPCNSHKYNQKTAMQIEGNWKSHTRAFHPPQPHPDHLPWLGNLITCFSLVLTAHHLSEEALARRFILRLSQHEDEGSQVMFWVFALFSSHPVLLVTGTAMLLLIFFAPAAAACFRPDRINWVWMTAGRRATLRHTYC